MKFLLFLPVALCLSFTVQAEKGRSIMFGDPDPVYTEKRIDTATDDHAEHCKKLRQKMKGLEGKPLRRNPVAKRFEIECVGQSDRIYQSE